MSTRSDYDVTTHSARPTASRLGPQGWAVVTGSAVTFVGALVSVVVDPSVPGEMFAYPFSPDAFRATQVLWALCQALVLFGVLGLGVLVRSRFGRVATGVAVAGAALMVPAQLVMILAADSSDDSSRAMTAQTVIGLVATLFAVGLVLVTVAARRERTWSGWGSWTPLVAGLTLFSPVVLDGIGPDAFLFGIALTNAAFVALGLALVAESRR